MIKYKVNPEIRERFENEYQKWHKETFIHSNSYFIFENEHFKNMENMGIEIVPLIVEKLNNEICPGAHLTVLLERLLPDVIKIEKEGYINFTDYIKIWLTALMPALESLIEYQDDSKPQIEIISTKDNGTEQ